MTSLQKHLLTLFFSVSCLQATSQTVLNQGTLTFEFVNDSSYLTAMLSHWDTLAVQLYEAGLYDHLDSAKAAAERVKVKQLADMKDHEIIEYTFIQNKVGALARKNEEKPFNFTLYDFDSLTIQINAELNEKILVSNFPIHPVNDPWTDEQNVVSKIDSNDVKTILGFRCEKYYFRHSHRMVKTNELIQLDFEMYVTREIDFPLVAILPMCRTSPFKGCPLEYAYVHPSHKTTYRAISFIPQVELSKLEAPTHLKKK